MDYRIFWLVYLLCIGFLLAAIAGCGVGDGCTYSAWVKL